MKKGDYVKVVGANPYIQIGSICKLVEKVGLYWQVEYSGMKRFLLEGDLALLPPSRRDLKIGDIVRIKSKDWYDANKDADGNVLVHGLNFTPEMSRLCGRCFMIERMLGSNGYLLEDFPRWLFRKEMFDCSTEFDTEQDTFEEVVLEKPLGIGDTVTIKSIGWYHSNKNEYGKINCDGCIFTHKMSHYCGRSATIEDITTSGRYILAGCRGYHFSDSMFELPTKKAKASLIESFPILEVDSEPILTEDIPLINNNKLLINLSVI